jgi:hypothetical protein
MGEWRFKLLEIFFAQNSSVNHNARTPALLRRANERLRALSENVSHTMEGGGRCENRRRNAVIIPAV